MGRYIALLLFASSAFAQNDISHSGAWFMYFGDHFWNEHWGLHAEGQLRRVEGILHGQQLLIRPGIDYQVNPHLMLMAGYTNIQNYSFDRFSNPDRVNEHRIHEEATVFHPLKRLKFQHRFRLEQRFSSVADDWQYRNRFRYRFLVQIPVTKVNYLAAYNEIFANFGARSTRAFDQNRVYGAIGHDFGKPGRLEIGYLYQNQQLTDIRFRHVHAFQMAFFSKIPLRKRR